eukprot:symbB.v1.2.040404.t1/scaffold7204.1/size12670/1
MQTQKTQHLWHHKSWIFIPRLASQVRWSWWKSLVVDFHTSFLRRTTPWSSAPLVVMDTALLPCCCPIREHFAT